jgi:O-6-methylguanine DNA methyltransferase
LGADRAGGRQGRSDGRTFERRVLAVVRRIPVGRVTTYGTVAVLAGRPRAARAVGNIMQAARAPGLPYHRVIAAGGRLGGYSDPSLKRALLGAEGLRVARTRVLDFDTAFWPSRPPSPVQDRSLRSAGGPRRR